MSNLSFTLAVGCDENCIPLQPITKTRVLEELKEASPGLWKKYNKKIKWAPTRYLGVYDLLGKNKAGTSIHVWIVKKLGTTNA